MVPPSQKTTPFKPLNTHRNHQNNNMKSHEIVSLPTIIVALFCARWLEAAPTINYDPGAGATPIVNGITGVDLLGTGVLYDVGFQTDNLSFNDLYGQGAPRSKESRRSTRTSKA